MKLNSLLLSIVALLHTNVIHAFVNLLGDNVKQQSRMTQMRVVPSLFLGMKDHDDAINKDDDTMIVSNQRRATFALIAGVSATLSGGFHPPLAAFAEESSMYSPGFVQEYADFTKTDEGWSYRDVKVGDGETPSKGDRVVFDWSGYTIGYFGRPFEAKGGPQGGAFDKDLDFFRTILGSGQMVKGLECAMTSMKPGGIRQVLVPYGELGYPADDPSHDRVGPKPTTFSGQRALNFVLENPRVDRTLLFNVKLIRVDKPDGKGGFMRGDKRT